MWGMFGIDVDRFKVLKPWRDSSFWMALVSTIVGLALSLADMSVPGVSIDVLTGSLPAWLVAHKILRASAARALGEAVAAAVAHDRRTTTYTNPIDAPESAGVTP